MNRPRPDYGNGPPCPDSPEHGHLYELTRGAWCPVTSTYPFGRTETLRGRPVEPRSPRMAGTGPSSERLAPAGDLGAG